MHLPRPRTILAAAAAALGLLCLGAGPAAAADASWTVGTASNDFGSPTDSVVHPPNSSARGTRPTVFYVQPLIAGYLRRLEDGLDAMGLAAPVFLMLSGGGLTTIETACRFPIRLVESGPCFLEPSRLRQRGAETCVELPAGWVFRGKQRRRAVKQVHRREGVAAVIRGAPGGLLAGLTAALGGQTEIEGKRAMTIPLRFSDGAVFFGPIPLGQLPPVY